MYQCEKCNLEMSNKGSYQRHIISCKLNIDDVLNIKKEYIDDKKSIHYIEEKYKINLILIKKILGENIRTKLESRKYIDYSKIKVTEKTKLKISEGRKKYLKENPDKHPWKNNNKFISIPCEKLKEVLNNRNIKYISEYTPLSNFNYSLDIAFPNIKLGIEINGNQHYNNDKTLKYYYQNRHDLLVKNGWNILELHYTYIYKDDKINDLVDYLLNQNLNFNIDDFILNKPLKYDECKCGNKKLVISPNCNKCKTFKRRKIERPVLQILVKNILELGYVGTGKKYNVSDNAIRKWVKII